MTERSLYAWFAAWVHATPAAPALEVAGTILSYAELDAVAAGLAAELTRVRGRQPRTVGLYAGRTVAAYAGYLAAQRLGCTVVPLNPAFPAAFVQRVAADGGVDAVLAQTPAPELPYPVLAVDDALVARCLDAPPAPPSTEVAEVAYVLFTSGSTGTPKGVPITHGNVSAYLEEVIARYELGPGCRTSQTFDLTFDLSVFDLFATWGSGACLVVPTRKQLVAPTRFVNDARITHWFSVPSVISLARRLGRLDAGGMPDLRWSLFCGEPLTVEQAAAWQAAAPASVLENLYGPTELTLSCARYRFPVDPAQRWTPPNGTVPIGELLPGHDELVVDEAGRPAVEGELCVRGPQRFGGYLDPAHNTGRFFGSDGERAVPWDAAPAHDTWYRTGDRVRRTEEAGLVHLGRLDHQVKVQGYRVELGEIEHAVREQNGVQDAVVVALTASGGHTVLSGVYTGQADPDVVLARLRERLPAHVVPRSITRWPELPLNGNGKVDRGRIAGRLDVR